MDAEGETLWKATLNKAGIHDKAVWNAHDVVKEPEVDAYWVEWNQFKASLKSLNDEVESTFSIVTNGDIEVKSAELDALIVRFNSLGVRIQARKLNESVDILTAAIAKQKRGEPLTDEEIKLIAKSKVEGEKAPIKDSPVKPTHVTPSTESKESSISVAWWLFGGAIGAIGVAVLVSRVSPSKRR